MMQGLTLLLAALLEVLPGEAAVPAGITVEAGAATAEVLRTPGGRRLVALPSLSFPLSIEPRCEAGKQAESLSVTVADSRSRFDSADLGDRLRIETLLEVPRQQVAPIAIERFCHADEEHERDVELLVPAAMTAHISLRCSDGESRSIHFFAAPLDIRLVCRDAGELPIP